MKLLVRVAYFLEASDRYAQIKEFFNRLLNDPDYPLKKYFDYTMIFLIISSVVILIQSVKYDLPPWLLFYDIYIVSSLFLIEYLLRMWVFSDIHKIIIRYYEEVQFLEKRFFSSVALLKIARNKWEYVSSPIAIIDLLAILPTYRPLRILRIFILFRIFKILRYTKSVNQFLDVIHSKKFEILTLGMLLFFVVFTAGVTIYVFESGVNDSINSLFDGLYWALVTISTVGFGDITPVTTGGKVVSMVVILSGIGMISFATSIVVSAFSEKMDEIRESRAVMDTTKKDDFIIICGYGQMCNMLIDNFKRNGITFIIIEKDYDKTAIASKKGLNIINEDATQHKTLNRFDLDSVKAVLATTSSDVANIYITLNVRSISKSVPIISRANHEKMTQKLFLAGATDVVKPYDVAGMMAAVYIDQPVAFEAINAILTAKKNAHFEQVTVQKDLFLQGKRIKDIDFAKYKIILIGVFRDDEFIFNPTPYFELRADDVLIIMGYIISIDWFKKLIQRSRITHER